MYNIEIKPANDGGLHDHQSIVSVYAYGPIIGNPAPFRFLAAQGYVTIPPGLLGSALQSLAQANHDNGVQVGRAMERAECDARSKDVKVDPTDA